MSRADPALERATLRVARGGLYRGHGKRLLDLVLVALALPVVLPVVLGAGLWLLAQGRAPFVARACIGRRGRRFDMLDLDLPACGAGPLARLLRRSGVAAWPRLWAVARGEMSIIGPRPLSPEARDPHAPAAPVLDTLRPGLCAMWQDATVHPADAALAYARDLSLGLDLRLLWQALVTRRHGAQVRACA